MATVHGNPGTHSTSFCKKVFSRLKLHRYKFCHVRFSLKGLTSAGPPDFQSIKYFNPHARFFLKNIIKMGSNLICVILRQLQQNSSAWTWESWGEQLCRPTPPRPRPAHLYDRRWMKSNGRFSYGAIVSWNQAPAVAVSYKSLTVITKLNSVMSGNSNNVFLFKESDCSRRNRKCSLENVFNHI